MDLQILDGGEETSDEELRLSESVSMYPNRPLAQRGIVFEGTFTSNGNGVRECAVKLPREKSQYERETSMLNEIGSDSYVISILGHGHFRDGFLNRSFIVLEKCHKLNLHQLLMRPEETVPIFNATRRFSVCKQLIEGVTFIHNKQVVHKDLKPSNVLLTPDLECVKVADFGSCQRVPSYASAIACPEMFGTTGYRPPESYGNSYVSLRTDSFSLGAMFYFILSNGKSPFGDHEDMWDYNAKNGITNMCDLQVPNRKTTKHLISAMLHTKRHRRPSIWEVFSHPCWSESDVDFEHEYKVEEVLVEQGSRATTPSYTAVDITTFFKQQLFRKLSPTARSSSEKTEASMVICNKYNSSLQLYTSGKPTLDHLFAYNKDMKTNFFSVVAVINHIYVLTQTKSVHRLICDGVRSRWKQMEDMITYHGQHPPAVENHDNIYVIGISGVTPSSCVSKFEPAYNKWTTLQNKKVSTACSAIASLDGFVYAIGGVMNEAEALTDTVERINHETGCWENVASLLTARQEAPAVPHGGNIYVLGGKGEGSLKLDTAEMYDPKRDQWTSIPSLTKPRWGPRCRGHVINEDIYFVGGDGPLFGKTIGRYDHISNTWNAVELNEPNLQIWTSVTVDLPKPN